MKLKITQLLTLTIGSLFLLATGCSEKKVETVIDKDNFVCYQAIFERDTAWMKIDTSKQFMEGDMSIQYSSKNQKYVGHIRGEMKGDTLVGSFNFKINDLPTGYSTPVSMLKRDGKLIMGSGKVVIMLGRSYFSPEVPIDYDNSRFEFTEVPCAN